MTKSARRFPSDEAHRIKLRLPAGLRASIGQAARQEGRSMTAEMQQRIRRCPAPSPAADVNVGRTSEQFLLRLAEGMHEQLVAAARSSGRSLNSEIVLRLLSDTTQNTADTQEPSMARTDPTVYMKLPADLKASIEAAAAANRRSITAEIVHRLAAYEGDVQATEPAAGESDFGAAIRVGGNVAPLGLRMPPGLKALVISASLRKGRSMNAEICDALAERYGKGSAPTSKHGPDRDTLAAMAMQGLLARPFTNDERGRPFVAWVVSFSYELADEMVKAREGGAA